MKKLFPLLFLITLTGVSCAPAKEIACGYDGQRYEVGDSFLASDGCNTCSCGPDGQISCTEIACESPVDQCQTAADCLDQGIDTSFCEEGEWSCVNAQCEFQCGIGM